MTPGKGETKSRKPPVSNEATEERLAGGKAQEDLTLSMSKADALTERVSDADQEANSDTFNFKKFQGCLLKPALGRDSGSTADPKTHDRREKVKEVRRGGSKS
uniref:PPUP7109 n=1 Tax=Poeciliopsis prolifica TaxID=188132 RepID=A0A0S7EUW1_9TELE